MCRLGPHPRAHRARSCPPRRRHPRRRRRERVERSVADSYELQSRLRDQRRAVAAVRALATERAPLALRLRRRALPLAARPRSPLLGLGLAGVLGAVVLAFATVGGGQAGLTVAEAATLAAGPPTARVAEPADDAATLPHVSAAGLPFPLLGGPLRLGRDRRPPRQRRRKAHDHGLLPQPRPADRVHDRPRRRGYRRPPARTRSRAAASSSTPSPTAAG